MKTDSFFIFEQKEKECKKSKLFKVYLWTTYYGLFTEVLINKFSIEHELTKKQITEFIAEFYRLTDLCQNVAFDLFTSHLPKRTR